MVYLGVTMQQKFFDSVIKKSTTAKLEITSSVVRNTCTLLAMTILFSAFTAFISTFTGSSAGSTLSFLFWIPLILLIQKTKNSAWGILAVFALTGLMGYSLGPAISQLLSFYKNGAEILIASLSLTGSIFLTLSCYVILTRKNFNYLEGFLVVGINIALFVVLMSMVFNFPLSMVVYSSFMVLIASGWILFDVSRILNGGEQNYIIATIQIYLDLFNLFVNLLNLLTLFAGRKD